MGGKNLKLLAFLLWLLALVFYLTWGQSIASKLTDIFDFATLGIKRSVVIEGNNGEKLDINDWEKNLVKIAVLEAENKELREALQLGEVVARPKAVGRVISRGIGKVTIDVGEKTGVGEGNLVLVKGRVIGRVGRVGQWTSDVALVSSKDFGVEVEVRGGVSGARRAIGVVSGKAGQIVVSKVLESELLARGDIVVALDGGLERSELVVGVIDEVWEGDGVYKSAVVENGINDNFDTVLVLIE